MSPDDNYATFKFIGNNDFDVFSDFHIITKCAVKGRYFSMTTWSVICGKYKMFTLLQEHFRYINWTRPTVVRTV